MRAVIITAQGADNFTDYLHVTSGDLVIAADGGWNVAAACGVTPNLLVGDMDSIAAVPDNVKVIQLPVDKNDTDTHFCARIAVDYGCGEVVIAGGTGGRFDHTLANLHTLAFLAERNIRASMLDGRTEMYMLKDGGVAINGHEGHAMALIAYGGDARGVCSHGVKFPLNNALLTPTFPLGVSNTVISANAGVSVADGFLLVMLL